jgi:hypothetical protein
LTGRTWSSFIAGSGSGGMAVMNVPGRSVVGAVPRADHRATALGAAEVGDDRGIRTRKELDGMLHTPAAEKLSCTPA